MKFRIAPRLFRYIALQLIALAILFASYFRLADNYELEALDLMFNLRPKPVTTDNIVLIEIGDDTIRNFGQWPIARNYHALLVNALSEAHIKSIIFDIFFSEPTTDDSCLERAINNAGNVYLPFVFELNKKRAPFAAATGYAEKNLKRLSLVDKGEGHINIFPDIDGKFRRVPLLIRYKDRWYPHISFLATCDYLEVPIKSVRMVPGKYISFGDVRIPLDDHSNMIINFSGKWGKAYQHYSYYDIVQSYLAPIAGQKPILDLNIFKNKICIVGLTATGTSDLHPSPLEALYPGFGIHMEIVNSILNKHFICRASRGVNLAILMLLVICIVTTTLRMKPIKGLFLLILVELLLGISGILVFNAFGIWLDFFYPAIVLIMLYLSLTLYKYITEWKKGLIIENELGIAAQIQKSFLPIGIPDVRGIDIKTVMFTARQVGGDLYDFLRFDDGRLGVMIGDVSGKGIPASLFMAKVMSEFKFVATTDTAPENVLRKLNSKIVKESSSNLFVTIFYIVFDMHKRTARFSNSGHLPVIRLNAQGVASLLDIAEGTPLGLIDSDYGAKELHLEKGDIFVLYTDGLTEAMNEGRELYGEKRLIEVIKSYRELSSGEILKAVEKDVRSFEHRSAQHDDMTLIVIRITET